MAITHCMHEIRNMGTIIFFILRLQFAYSVSSISYSPQNHLCPFEQSLALLQFKQAFTIIGGASEICDFQSQPPKSMSWNSSTDCCTWDGVTCDGLTGHVVDLDLSCSQLQGVISSNSTLFHLSHLKRLNLAFNDFALSPISHMFGRFASLTHLNLSCSDFSGEIPSEFSRLSKLVSLDLSENFEIKLEHQSLEMLLQNLTRLRELSLSFVNVSSALPFPMNLSSSLTFLDLSCSEFHGKFPDQIFHLPNLQMLKLSSNNGLTGDLPEFNLSASVPLRWLDLSGTSLLGKLPDSIGYLQSLNYLQLSGCKFSGSIPESIGNLTQITILDLSENNFNGELPNSIGYLKSLNSLQLSRCKFSASIPDSIGNLSQIIDLVLYENSFSGKIPSTLSNLEQLTRLDISYNNYLEGQIPNVFANLTHLRQLSLAGNNFGGPFPSSIANLTQLVSLDLSSNSLTGPLPTNIVGLHNLLYLVLSNNSLNGKIPSWLFALPALVSLDLSSNQFTALAEEFPYNSVLETTDLSNNELYGLIPKSISKLHSLLGLHLSRNNLIGIVELDIFLKITNLVVLDLSHNNLSLLSLSSCKMKELSYNQIHCQLPNWVGSMTNSLKFLDLSHNFLTGLEQLIWDGLKVLEVLDLRSNLLQGPLLSSICNLSSLEILDLSNNRFGGAIPQCLGNLSGLSVLDLRMNSFHGTIPTTFAKENTFRNLNLHGNQLEGMLPQSLANCICLEVLDLGNNQINDTFPQWLGTLPQLQVLVLRYNRFNGPIRGTPTTKHPFGKLRIIDLSHNQFTGVLPTIFFGNLKAMMNMRENETAKKYMGERNNFDYYDEVTVVMKDMETNLVRILTIFTTIDLSSNKFEGEIPDIIGNLNSLRVLNLSDNSLIGHIPSMLGNLSVLESLDLSSNQLVGEIPQQLTGLTFLAVLNLSQNHLEGQIPQGKQFNTFSNISYSGNSALCGFPLSKQCGDEKTPQPSVFQQKGDSDFASGFTWKAVLMGYGCGVVFGSVMGYLMLLIRKPKWFTGIVEKGQHKNIKRSVKRGHRHYGRRN